MLDLIAFDADDTLWHNERFYADGRRRFHEILAPYDISAEVDERLDEVELGNLRYYGYGVMSFVLSLIEAGIQVTGGQLAARDVQRLLEMGKEMLSTEVELFPGAEETLSQLSGDYPLMLITKGDLLHQQAKVEKSGLAGLFTHVEVVSDKRPATYDRILRRHRLQPSRFLMVGNSMRSDILPVVELGGWAVHIPNPLTWSHEQAAAPAGAHYFEVASLHLLPDFIQNLVENGAGFTSHRQSPE